MFEKARIKLTAWYLLIIMFISILFSMLIFYNINGEYEQFETMQERFQEREELSLPINRFRTIETILDKNIIEAARIRLITTLGFINLIILITAGTAGYFLAGRTLTPIKEMLLDQERFVSDSSHEFRTPLTTLRTEIEVGLRDKKLTIAKAKDLLKSNLEEVVGLQNLSDSLLLMAENGNSNSSPTNSLPINNLLNAAIKKVATMAKEKSVEIYNNTRSTKISVVEDRIKEAFVILLENAVKYSNKGGKIEIDSKVINENLEILVTDYGIGIDKKDLPHIFNRFYRADKSRSVKGYGLGLPIAKKLLNIIKEH